MKISSRKGVSPIVAELLLIAITVSIGSTVFFVGTSSIGGYANGFSLLFGQNANAAQEIYVVEYANFISSPSTVNITIRNVGYVVVELASVSMFNRTHVTSPYAGTGMFTRSTTPALTLVKSTASPYCSVAGNMIDVPVQAFCTVSVSFAWQPGATYDVVVSTERGNSLVVEEVA